MLPGVVDSHGHTYLIGLQATTANLLPPPDGTGKDIAFLQALLTDWAANNKGAVNKVGWIAGFGYDDVWLYLKDVLDRTLAGSTDWESMRADHWKEQHPEAVDIPLNENLPQPVIDLPIPGDESDEEQGAFQLSGAPKRKSGRKRARSQRGG